MQQFWLPQNFLAGQVGVAAIIFSHTQTISSPLFRDNRSGNAALFHRCTQPFYSCRTVSLNPSGERWHSLFCAAPLVRLCCVRDSKFYNFWNPFGKVRVNDNTI
jgi:hypothetical protein